MWFGTPNGVSAYAHGRWQSYLATDGLPSNDVACLTVDSAGVVWVGTANGLAFVERWASRSAGRMGPTSSGNQSRAWPPTSAVRFWIATSNHVVRVPRDKLLRGELSGADVRSYGLPDGLHSVDGVRRHRSVVVDPGGRVWFSLGRGLSMTDPADAAGGSAPAIVHVESVSADGTPSICAARFTSRRAASG